MTQTTPTRDEAVRKTTERLRYTASINARRFDDDHPLVGELREAADLIEALASAPAPASGGVDAVKEAWSFLQDRLLEFEQEIGSGEEEREWAGHVHPALTRFNRLIASLSPAATPVSEAGGERDLVADLAAVVRVQNGNRHDDINALLARADAALAKPASSPAGVRDRIKAAIRRGAADEANGQPNGDIIVKGCEAAEYCDPGDAAEAFVDAIADEILTQGSTDFGGLGEVETLVREYDPKNSDWYFQRTVILEILAAIRPAALSQSTSAGRVGE